MLNVTPTPITGLFLGFAVSLKAIAAPAALPLSHQIDLDEFRGQTFLEAMTAERKGIKAKFDADYKQQYTFADWRQVNAALANFDRKIVNRVLGAFANGKAGLQKFTESLSGRTFTPDNVVNVIKPRYNGRGNIYVLAHFMAMASGAGTVVHIDEDNYYYNFGYKSGAEPDDVKSGRSYGAAPLHNANDASDVMYLNELEQYLQSTRDPKEFYETFLEILTLSDDSDYSRLSPIGQTAQTDLIAIYTAELDRHLMVNLNPRQHPWENDLAEATFVSIYSAASGKIMKDGSLQNARLRDWWAMSTVSDRSGIGITRGDRRELQREISSYMREKRPDLVKAVEAITGRRFDGDVFRGLMEFLNNKKTQERVKRNAKQLTSAFVDFLSQVKQDSAQITAAISD